MGIRYRVGVFPTMPSARTSQHPSTRRVAHLSPALPLAEVVRRLSSQLPITDIMYDPLLQWLDLRLRIAGLCLNHKGLWCRGAFALPKPDIAI